MTHHLREKIGKLKKKKSNILALMVQGERTCNIKVKISNNGIKNILVDNTLYENTTYIKKKSK